MKVRGGEFSTGTMGNFQPELTTSTSSFPRAIFSKWQHGGNQDPRDPPKENADGSSRFCCGRLLSR
jgi:hypothetical protein